MDTKHLPLISAVMPVTPKDYPYLEGAIKCFMAQTYSQKELVIVNNAETQFEAAGLLLPSRKNVMIFDTPALVNIGMAMNYGSSVVTGELIARWSVQYYYSKDRLQTQFKAMIDNEAQVSLLNDTLSYNSNTNYCVSYGGEDYNTAVYVRHKEVDYDDVVKNEDFQIVSKLCSAGYKAVSVDGSLLACRLYGDKKLPSKIKFYGSEVLTSDHYKFIKSGVRNRIKHRVNQ